MAERRESEMENIIALLILPAVALLEAIEVGNSERAGKVRDAFAGLTEIFAFIALPILIPFMETGKGKKKE